MTRDVLAGRMGRTSGAERVPSAKKQRLDVPHVPGDADHQAKDRGDPRPDPLPHRPPVQVRDVQRELPHDEEHVDLGRPRHRLPPAEPMMRRPLVQSRVAVRQSIRAGQDGEHRDRVKCDALRPAGALFGQGVRNGIGSQYC